MRGSNRGGLIAILVCFGLSILPYIAHNGNAWVDFRAVYAGTRCLLHGHNPYNVAELAHEYQSEDGQRPPDGLRFFQSVTLYVNMPTTFVVVAPFAVLLWGPAHTLWIVFTMAVFVLATLLMWNLGADYSPEVSIILACLFAFDSQGIFVAGNTAGIVVGFCVIAVWCFIRNRFVWAGVFCLSLSLAIKPHDSGLIWLYFLLIGGTFRKWAVRSFILTIVIALGAVIWVSFVAPHWLQDWRSNLNVISAPGGINEPGPSSITGRSGAPVIDLQAALSIFLDYPPFYNVTSYTICGALLLAWIIRTMRSRFSVAEAWLALAAVAALTMLVTYHRAWDAKLLMLAIPPCCMLWARGTMVGKIALAVTVAAIFCVGDFTLGAFKLVSDSFHLPAEGVFGKVLTVLLMRPASLALIAICLFYLWIYVWWKDLQQDVDPNLCRNQLVLQPNQRD
jgi:hypothetical protein